MKNSFYLLTIIMLWLFAAMNDASGQWNTSGTNIYNSNTGNVGIGNTAPATLLHVAKNMTEPQITVQNLGGFGGATYTMMDQASGANWKFKATLTGGFKIRDHANLMDVFVIEPNSAANTIYINADGKVGIGTNVVNSKLHVYYSTNSGSLLGFSDNHLNYFYHYENPAIGDGQTALFTFRGSTTPNDGTDYDLYYTNTALTASSYNGNLYTFGCAGYNYNDYSRCGGVLGAQEEGNYWGSLGYKSSGSVTYGGYFTSTGNGAGKSYKDAFTGIGLGAWGDLFGADIHGEIYGAYIEGQNYALYTHGTVYKDGLDVHLQSQADGSNAVLYTNVTSEATIQTCGTATLSAGKANISFDPTFASVVSDKEPIIITITPTGESNGVFLAGVSKDGFSVKENNAGKSNVTVNYIAVGKRAGYEKPSLAPEVVQGEHARIIAGGLHNDADTQTNGNGVYYENGQLKLGTHPSLQPGPGRQAVVPEFNKESAE